MMTFKELKKLVKLPLYKEQRVPTVKALEESGVSVVAEKILENHGSISVYQNGYVIYRAHKRVTVFSLRNCVHYKYDALEGAGHHIEEEEFEEYEWHIRLVLEGDNNIKSFDRVARKYGIDYSLKKAEKEGKTEYLVFFKAKDVDVMTAAFKEYTGVSLKKEQRQSIRKKLEQAKERVAKHREITKEKTKDRGQVR
jgi:hypothetical protein